MQIISIQIMPMVNIKDYGLTNGLENSEQTDGYIRT